MIKRNGRWYSAEINLTKSLGYGEYYFFVASRIDRLNKNVVTGYVIQTSIERLMDKWIA